MTPDPLTVSPEATAREAGSLMDDASIRHLPVVDPRGRLIGIVSDRDLRGLSPGPGTADLRVRDVMHEDVVTLSRTDTLVSAAVELGVRKIGALPVVDDAGLVVGIVSETDLLDCFRRACADGVLGMDEDPVAADVMSRAPSTVAPEQLLTEAVALLRALHVRHLPVVERGRCLGVLSDRDARRAAGRASLPAEVRVAEACSRELVSAGPDARLSEVAGLLLRHRIGCVPVLGEDGMLVGILTTEDVVERCLLTLWQIDAAETLSPGSDSGTPAV